MSAFDFATESGVWSNEMVPGAAHYWRWDVTQSKLVNGDDGGIWNPTSPIGIGGAGLQLTTGASYFFGGARTQTGGRIILGTHDVPSLNYRTITRVMGLHTLSPQNLGLSVGTLTSLAGTSFKFPQDAYLRVVSPGLGPVGVSPIDAAFTSIPIPREYLISGAIGSTNAVLGSVTLNFRVLSKPSSVPSSPFNGLTIRPTIVNPNGSDTLPPFDFINLLVKNQGGNGIWAASTHYVSGWYIVPQTKQGAPASYFKCAIAGTSGSTEPNWNRTPGATTTDGGVTWVCIGGTGQLWAPNVDAYYNDGQPQQLTCALDTAIAGSQPLDLSFGGYAIAFLNMPTDGSILYHSLVFNFVNIYSWTWL